ncbi:hypothetical protein OQA88_8226 [Cercophora sp. LCS_1]
MMVQHEWPEAQRKRAREDEYADISGGGTLGFTEHRSKRLQSLPLRTSPNSKRWAERPSFPSNPSFGAPAAPSTITPGESPSEEQLQQRWADEPELVSSNGMAMQSIDQDMDMMDTSDHPTIQGQIQHLEPGALQPDMAAVPMGARMPTPINCSFAAQIRGNNWGGAAGNALSAEDHNPLAFNVNTMVGMCQPPSLMGHESVPRSLDGPAAAAQVMADWNMVQNRRLPSPISENGGEDSPESPRMSLDSSAQQIGHLDHLTHHHPLLSSLPARSNSAGELGQASPPPREGTPGSESVNGNAMDVESPATPSPKKGHTRSRHTLNSWTALQPGMKRSFSIGYRADCEKCRMKVPGHFNHIILS